MGRRGIVGVLRGRQEVGPRALGHRSLVASPLAPDLRRRFHAVTGRRPFDFLPLMVPLANATDLFTRPLVSPYMSFVRQPKV